MVRHGQIVNYDQIPVCGYTDIDVTEVGNLQLERLAERLRLASIGAIYSSDLQRSIKGAQIIACHHDVPINHLHELREMNFGDWEGLTLEEIRTRFPDELEKRKRELIDFQPPGEGESIKHLCNRVIPCFKNILEEQNGNDFLIVGHGGVNRVILCHALGLDLSQMFNIQQNYGCLNIVDYFPDSTLVRLMNG
jgi:alpha-ribazole phosphatase/probable phosphoglycerate mutase